MNNHPDHRKVTFKPKDEPGVGDDIPCSKCGAVALDTGLECDECGHDMAPELNAEPPTLPVSLGATVTLDALEKALRQTADLGNALERLTLWARNMVGRCECTGDHPIAHAERTLGWRK